MAVATTYVNSATRLPSKTITLTEFAEAKPTSQLSYYSLSLIERDKKANIDYDVYNILTDYIADIKKMSIEIELSEEEYLKYRYRPKLLSEFVYGNGELYFVILWLNDIWSVKDFDMRKIKLVSKSKLTDALSSINSSERSFIDRYNESASETN